MQFGIAQHRQHALGAEDLRHSGLDRARWRPSPFTSAMPTICVKVAAPCESMKLTPPKSTITVFSGSSRSASATCRNASKNTSEVAKNSPAEKRSTTIPGYVWPPSRSTRSNAADPGRRASSVVSANVLT